MSDDKIKDARVRVNWVTKSSDTLYMITREKSQNVKQNVSYYLHKFKRMLLVHVYLLNLKLIFVYLFF